MPPDTTPPTPPAVIRHIVLEYTSDKRISMNKQDVSLLDLGQRLRDLYNDRTEWPPAACATATSCR